MNGSAGLAAHVVPLLQQVEAGDEAGKHNGHGGHQLDEDVQRGPGSILEGVAHGVADDGGLVALLALASMVPGFNVLFRVVPGAARVGHEHRHGEAGDGHPAQQTHNPFHA